MKTLEQRGQRLLPAIAYGDALGLPVENQSAEDITATHGRITQLIECSGHTFFPAAPLGTSSDDTQHARALMEAMIEVGGYDAEFIAQQLVSEYEKSSAGWGGSTVAAMKALQSGLSVSESGTKTATGCGPLMRMGTLAYYHAAAKVDKDEALRQVEEMARLSHDNVESVIVAGIHAATLRHCFETQDGSEILNQSVRIAQALEQRFSAETDEVSVRMQALLDAKQKLSDDQILIELSNAASFRGLDVLTASLGVIAHESHFIDAVQRVIHLGGDTDSTGAVVAGYATALHGDDLPADANQLQQFDELTSISARFAQTFTS